MVLLLWAAPVHADSYLEYSDDEADFEQTDPPLQIDPAINHENPLALIDPAYNWPDYSDDSEFEGD